MRNLELDILNLRTLFHKEILTDDMYVVNIITDTNSNNINDYDTMHPTCHTVTITKPSSIISINTLEYTKYEINGALLGFIINKPRTDTKIYNYRYQNTLIYDKEYNLRLIPLMASKIECTTINGHPIISRGCHIFFVEEHDLINVIANLSNYDYSLDYSAITTYYTKHGFNDYMLIENMYDLYETALINYMGERYDNLAYEVCNSWMFHSPQFTPIYCIRHSENVHPELSNMVKEYLTVLDDAFNLTNSELYRQITSYKLEDLDVYYHLLDAIQSDDYKLARNMNLTTSELLDVLLNIDNTEDTFIHSNATTFIEKYANKL